jgi:hypothetical protein
MQATTLGLFLALVAASSLATPAEAQLGGLMRRAREAVKEPTPEIGKKPGAPASSPAPNPFADPAIVFITQDQLGRFDKALRYEVAQRAALRKTLASLSTREEYQACSQGMAISPEAMQIIQDYADANANGTAEQMMKATQKMSTDLGALVTKKCGPDPTATASTRLERVRQIEAEASDIAMPPGWTPPPGYAARAIQTPSGRRSQVALSYRATRFSPYASAGSAARAQMPNPHPFARAYAMLKERIPVFCAKLDTKAPLPTTPMAIGTETVPVVKIPGSGQDYVFRQDEASALTAGCAGVMAQLNSLFDNQ